MKYIVVALHPDQEEYTEVDEYSSDSADELDDDGAQPEDEFSSEEFSADYITRTRYTQNHFFLQTILAQSLRAVDDAVEEEVDHIAEDGVTAVMRTIGKQYQVGSFDALENAKNFLEALHVESGEECTLEPGADVGNAHVSHIVLEVDGEIDANQPLNHIANRFLVLETAAMRDLLESNLAAQQEQFKELESQVAGLIDMTLAGREAAEKETGESFSQVSARKSAVLREVTQIEKNIELADKQGFIAHANPARPEERREAAATATARRGMFMPAMVRAGLDNDNNAPDEKGKEELDETFTPPGMK